MTSMLGDRKGLIRVAEVVAIVQTICSLLAAYLIAMGDLAPGLVESFIGPGMLLTGLVYVLSIALGREFQRVRGQPPPPPSQSGGYFVDFSFEEIKLLLRWCPAPYFICYLAIVPLIVYFLVSFGFGIHWRMTEELSAHQAEEFLILGAVMLLPVVPFLASVARMPGTFAQHFHPRLGNAHERRSTH